VSAGAVELRPLRSLVSATRLVVPVPVGLEVQGVAVDAGRVSICGRREGRAVLLTIDRATGAVRTVEGGAAPATAPGCGPTVATDGRGALAWCTDDGLALRRPEGGIDGLPLAGPGQRDWPLGVWYAPDPDVFACGGVMGSLALVPSDARLRSVRYTAVDAVVAARLLQDRRRWGASEHDETLVGLQLASEKACEPVRGVAPGPFPGTLAWLTPGNLRLLRLPPASCEAPRSRQR